MTQAKLPLTSADSAKIAAIVFERHGVVIPPDDPAWAIVTMSELVLRAVLADCLVNVNKLMTARTAELRAIWTGAERQARQTFDGHARAAVEQLRNVLRGEIAARGVAVPARRTPPWRWLVAGIATALVLFAAGFWVGRC